METYSHVVNKMRRAGIVGLFAVGLAFTGVAPASAIEGGNFQTQDLGQNGQAVALLQVPIPGSPVLAYRSCAGVLTKPDEVLTSNDCFSYANDPYKDVFNRSSSPMEKIAQRTARITFGKDAVSNTNAEKRVYFSVRAQSLEPITLGLAIVQLDRPVEGITPVTKVEGMAKDGDGLNMVGWQSTDFVPHPGSFTKNITSSDLRIAFSRGGGLGYYTSPQSWQTFLDQNKAIPKLDMPNGKKEGVVPAFALAGWRPAREVNKELGTPVLTGDGKLRGILVGYDVAGDAVFLDAGEPSIADKIFQEHTPATLDNAKDAETEEALATQYKNLRDMLCSVPAKDKEAVIHEAAKKKFQDIVKNFNAEDGAKARYNAAKPVYDKAKLKYDKAETDYNNAKSTWDAAQAAWAQAENDPSLGQAQKEAAHDKFTKALTAWNKADETFRSEKAVWESAEATFRPIESAYKAAQAAFDDAEKEMQKADADFFNPGRKSTPILGNLDKRSAETATDAANLVKTYNESVGDPAWFYTMPDPMHAPIYGVTTVSDPEYIPNMATDSATWADYCQSVEGINTLDMSMLFKRSVADREAYKVEKDKITQRVKKAEQEKNLADQALTQAKNVEEKKRLLHNVDLADQQAKKEYLDAQAATKVAQQEADAKTSAWEVLKDLEDQIVKGLDPVILDAENATKNGLANTASMVKAAQDKWISEDTAKQKAFEAALDKYLKAKKKKYDYEQAKVANAAIDTENASHFRPDPDHPGQMKYDSGYPKPRVPENKLSAAEEEILKVDPKDSYLKPGAADAKMERDLAGIKDSLNKAVPIMLESRYQIWNMKRMTEMLQKGESLNDADKQQMQQEIIDILKKQTDLGTKIRTQHGKMQESWNELEKLYASLPQEVKNQLDKKGYKEAVKKYNDAKLSYGGAESDLASLTEVQNRLADANTAAKMESLLKEASNAYANLTDILRSLEDATNALDKINNYGQAVVDGNVPKDKDPDPTWGMTEPQRKAYEEALAKQKAAEEKAAALEKAEADKKKAAEEAKKKAEQEKKDKDKKAKSEKDKKKDEQDKERLARALSKNTLRADGSDRVLTAIAAWKMGNFPGDSVVLVDGNVHADGLSATPFAAALHAPVLLTTWKTGLEPALLDQLKASGKKNIYLVGGQVPMNPYDEFELNEAGMTVHRIAGPDRFGTAVAVNQMTEPLVGAAPKKPLNLYIADGVGFPDALVAGAAAGRTGSLMLLSKGNTLDPNTFGYISALGQTRPLTITAVGGPAVHAVQNTPWPTTMSVNIKPIMGKDRYETAAMTAGTQAGTTAAVLVTGQDFPDALSGGALAVDQNAALVLTKTEELPPSSYQALQRYGANKTIVVGGPGAVSAKVAELVNGAALENPDSVNVTGTLKEREEVKAAAAAKLAELQERKLEAIKKGDWDTLAEIEKENQKAQSALRRYSTPSRAAAGTRTPASAGTNNSLDYVQSLLRSGNSMQDVFNKMGVSSISQLAHLINTGSPTAASMPYPNPTFS